MRLSCNVKIEGYSSRFLLKSPLIALGGGGGAHVFNRILGNSVISHHQTGNLQISASRGDYNSLSLLLHCRLITHLNSVCLTYVYQKRGMYANNKHPGKGLLKRRSRRWELFAITRQRLISDPLSGILREWTILTSGNIPHSNLWS